MKHPARAIAVGIGIAGLTAGCWVIAGLEDRTLLEDAALGGDGASASDVTTESATSDVADAGPADSTTIADGPIPVDAACEAAAPPSNASVVKCTKMFNCSLPLESCCPRAGSCATNDNADCAEASWSCSEGASCPSTDAGPGQCCAPAFVKSADTCPPVVELGTATCQETCPRQSVQLCSRLEACPPGQQCRGLDVQVDGGTLRFGTCTP